MRSKGLAAVGAIVVLALAAVAVAALTGAFRTAHASASGASRPDAIKVHGAWTLEVRQQGRLVRRVQFHNELTNPAVLARLLTGQGSVGQWSIGIGNQVCGTPATPLYCWNDQGGPGGVAQTHNVTVTTPTSGPDQDKIVLKGHFDVGVDGTINLVNSGLRECPASVAPSTTCSGGDWVLTQRSLATGVPVVAGQQVLETVKISFS